MACKSCGKPIKRGEVCLRCARLIKLGLRPAPGPSASTKKASA